MERLWQRSNDGAISNSHKKIEFKKETPKKHLNFSMAIQQDAKQSDCICMTENDKV